MGPAGAPVAQLLLQDVQEVLVALRLAARAEPA